MITSEIRQHIRHCNGDNWNRLNNIKGWRLNMNKPIRDSKEDIYFTRNFSNMKLYYHYLNTKDINTRTLIRIKYDIK